MAAQYIHFCIHREHSLTAENQIISEEISKVAVIFLSERNETVIYHLTLSIAVTTVGFPTKLINIIEEKEL